MQLRGQANYRLFHSDELDVDNERRGLDQTREIHPQKTGNGMARAPSFHHLHLSLLRIMLAATTLRERHVQLAMMT